LQNPSGQGAISLVETGQLGAKRAGGLAIQANVDDNPRGTWCRELLIRGFFGNHLNAWVSFFRYNSPQR